MKRRHLPITTALALLFLAGCQAKQSVVGKWKGKSVSDLPSTMDEQTRKNIEQSVKFLELEFKRDGSATFGGGGGPGLSGTYTVAGNKVSFKLDYSKLGLPAGSNPKPTELLISPDGKTMTMTADNSPGKVTLERVP